MTLNVLLCLIINHKENHDSTKKNCMKNLYTVIHHSFEGIMNAFNSIYYSVWTKHQGSTEDGEDKGHRGIVS